MEKIKLNTQVDWAPKEWFVEISKYDNFGSYFDHVNIGYQVFRHNNYLEIFKNINKNEIENFLDIGCANGILTNLISNHLNANHAIGIDFIDSLIKEASVSYPLIEFKTEDLPSISLEDNSMNLVVASEVLYYLKEESRGELVNNIHDVLTDNGYFVLGTKIGHNYFNLKSVERLLINKFKIINHIEIKLKSYDYFKNKIILLNKFIWFLEKDSLPFNESNKMIFLRYKYIFNNNLFLYIIKIFCYITRPLLSNATLPNICNKINVFGKASNIIYICRKV